MMANESPQVKLPGRIFRKGSRWWWNVQLPGEGGPRSRALKPEGSRLGTTDRRSAAQIALTMWQDAIRAENAAKIKAQEAAKALRLKTQFYEKKKALTKQLEDAEARAKAEATARAKLEAELDSLRNQVPRTAACECCGQRVPERDLRRIDSGQRLCRTCLDALHREAQRQEAKRRFLCPA
jgi:hypothetical protein